MLTSKQNRFANGFRWAWKFSLVMLALSLGLIVFGSATSSPGDINQGIKGLVLLPGQFLFVYILGFFFASDISKTGV